MKTRLYLIALLLIIMGNMPLPAQSSYLSVAEVMQYLNNPSTDQYSKTYTVRGYVTSWDNGYPYEDWATFYIDDVETGSTSLLRCTHLQASTAENARKLNVGDYVEVTDCYLRNTSIAELLNGTYHVISATTPPEIMGETTIANFLDTKDRKNTYQLTGVVSHITNKSSGCFYLSDRTGTIYVYWLREENGTIGDLSTLDIAIGDTITLRGAYQLYNDVDEVKNALFISRKKKVTVTVTFLDWDGRLLQRSDFQKGSDATSPTAPVRDGYVFTGWSQSLSNIQNELFVIALYERNLETLIPVYFMTNEGFVLETSYVATPVPLAPTIENKSFSGWETQTANIDDGITIRAMYQDSYSSCGDNEYYIWGGGLDTITGEQFAVEGWCCGLFWASEQCLLEVSSDYEFRRSFIIPAGVYEFKINNYGDPNTEIYWKKSEISTCTDKLSFSTKGYGNIRFILEEADVVDIIYNCAEETVKVMRHNDATPLSSTSHKQPSPNKIIINDHVFILRNGKTYSVQGQEVK